MPLVSYGDEYESLLGGSEIDINPEIPPGTVTDPSLLATLGAAFRTDNIVGSAISNETSGLNRYERDDTFNPLTEIKGTKYEARAVEASDIFNRRYFDAWKMQVDREEEDRRTIESAGWLGTGASAVAAILDLPTLIPGGAVATGARGGVAIGRTAASVAVAGGVGAAASEAGLQATQETRTATESAAAIGSGIVFGALLGGGVGALMSRAEQRAATQAIDTTREAAKAGTPFSPLADEMEVYARGGDDSIGAARADQDSIDDLSVGGGLAARITAKSTAKLNPIMRSLTSPSVVHRRLMNGIVENTVYLKKNFEGEGAAAVETLQKQWDRGAYGAALEEHLSIYREARAAGSKMTREDFSRAVGQASRRGDTGGDDFVSRAAKVWRERVVDPLKVGAQETGQLDKDLPNRMGETYFHRVYRRDKIRSQEPQFKAAIRPEIAANIDRALKADAGKAQKRTENLRREIDEYEMGILRRQSDANAREDGGEIALADGASEGDVIRMIEELRSGRRPAEPQRLTSFLRKFGLYDPGGDLASIGIGPRSAPGFVRSKRATAMTKGGGLGLDDAALKAWEDGFFPGWTERPTVTEFVQALEEDFRGLRRVVREADIDAARAADRISDMEAALARMGVDVKAPKFATSEDMKTFSAKINQALDEMDRQKVTVLRSKLAEVDAERERLNDPFLSDADREEYIEGILTDIVQKVTGVDQSDIPHGLVSVQQGPLKERTLKVPDRILEPWLEDDVELVNKRYARKMSADVELARKYGRADLQDQIKEVIDDYETLKRGVTDEKAMKALNDRRDRDIRDLKAVRDMLRGNYNAEANSTNFARIARAAGTFNYMRLMGGVLVASLTDAVRPAMVHGLTAYMRDGIVPLITNLKAVKMSAKDAKLAGAISERILQSRMATLAELTDPYSANSPFERFLDNAANKFTTLTGLNHWTDFQKTLSSTMTQNRILRNAERGFGAIKDREKAYMGYLGLDEDMADRVLKQFQEFGENVDGVRVANTEDWTDNTARRAYFAAINKDVDSTIVTKSVADVPLFAQSPIGRAVLQFKSFALASNQRVLMRGLQESPSRMVGGVMAMTTIGAFIYWLKQIEAGREPSNNPGTWVAEGLDRSGIFAIGFEINNALEKGGGPGVYGVLSKLGQAIDPSADAKQPASRFATRSVVEGFLGPTVGLANDAVAAASVGLRAANLSPEIKESDVQTARRLLPYATLPYWRFLIDGGFKNLKWQEATGFEGVVPELKAALAN